MEDLYNRLSMLKVLLNSHYGEGKIIKNVYEESYKIRKKIHSIKVRKEKIKRIFNV
jgi:hypothetical protein